MYRISTVPVAGGPGVWILEGSINAEAIETLMSSAQGLGEVSDLFLDLAGVTFLDAEAAVRLRALRDGGALLRNAPLYIKHVLDTAQLPEPSGGDPAS